MHREHVGAATCSVAVACFGAALVAVPLLVRAAGVCGEGCRVPGSVSRPSPATPADVMRARAETTMSLPAPLAALWGMRDGLRTESGVAVYSTSTSVDPNTDELVFPGPVDTVAVAPEDRLVIGFGRGHAVLSRR